MSLAGNQDIVKFFESPHYCLPCGYDQMLNSGRGLAAAIKICSFILFILAWPENVSNGILYICVQDSFLVLESE